jgi:uncharacterized RDD family membrane protein YckC
MNVMAHASAVPVSGPNLDNRRVLAALIDLAIVGVVGAVILAAAGALGGSVSEIGVPLAGVMLGWALYYYFACESASGQTLGKRLMKIRVVRTDGTPAGMREIALRTVLRVIDMQFVYLVGLIVMLATHERRGRLGDLVADTMIVSAEAEAESEPAPVAVEAPVTTRVPIAESGPAFAPDESVDIASPSLKELASDVSAVTTSSERKPDEDEPAPVEEPEPVVESEPEPAEPEDEPAAEVDAEPEEVTVRSVETVSAIDLVMGVDDGDEDAEDSDGDAVTETHTGASQS